MNKYEKSLNNLESKNYNDIQWFQEYYDDLDTLRELVEKATPIKPTHVHSDIYSCPECAVAFRLPKNRFVHYQYCDVCGQKLDWSEEDE